MRTRALGLGLVLWTAVAVPGLAAQEADVASEVRATLQAWADGQYAEFVGYYHPDARGFFLDGGPLMQGFTVAALQAVADAGFQADITIEELDVQLHGGTAVSVAYLVGKLTLPGGMILEGRWRYSEARVQTPQGWRVVQFHLSQQQA